jgi:hypothetical protein
MHEVLARRLDTALVIGRALGPGDAPGDEIAIDAFEAGDRRRAEPRLGARRDRVGCRHRLGRDIDHHLPVGDFGERLSVLRIERDDARIGGLDRRRQGGIADGQPDRCRAQPRDERRRLARWQEKAQLREVIERPRRHGDGDLGRVGVRIDAIGDLGLPVALRLHHGLEARQVLLGAAAQRRRRGRGLVFERGELRCAVERLGERLVRIAGDGDVDLIRCVGRGRTHRAHHQSRRQNHAHRPHGRRPNTERRWRLAAVSPAAEPASRARARLRGGRAPPRSYRHRRHPPGSARAASPLRAR